LRGLFFPRLGRGGQRMIKTIFATKLGVSQGFDQSLKRWPLTQLRLEKLVVNQLKTPDKDGYQAVQLLVGKKGLKREVRLNQPVELELKAEVRPATVLKAGDLVQLTTKSKGKGFTGVMKRWNFAGGPRTHGQSDRQRAPGSIGQRTDPGRVWKGKKMAGHSGHQATTVRNLIVMAVDEVKGELLVRGLIPGWRNSLVEVTKTGEVKNFKPLLEKTNG